MFNRYPLYQLNCLFHKAVFFSWLCLSWLNSFLLISPLTQSPAYHWIPFLGHISFMKSWHLRALHSIWRYIFIYIYTHTYIYIFCVWILITWIFKNATQCYLVVCLNMYILFLSVWLCCTALRILVPNQGLNLGHLFRSTEPWPLDHRKFPVYFK